MVVVDGVIQFCTAMRCDESLIAQGFERTGHPLWIRRLTDERVRNASVTRHERSGFQRLDGVRLE